MAVKEFLHQSTRSGVTISGAGTTPSLEKTLRECMGQMNIFPARSQKFRESLRELLRELWLSHCSSRETPFREQDFSFRELFFELRELLREYPGTLPELREWPFRSESVFPEIGVVPRLLTIRCRPLLATSFPSPGTHL